MKKLLSITFFCLIIFSCKKKDTTEPPQAPQTSDNISTDGIIINGLPINTNGINGAFFAKKYTGSNFSGTFYMGTAGMFITGQPLKKLNPSIDSLFGNDNGGVLKINNKPLKYYDTPPYDYKTYVDTTVSANYSTGVSWNLMGNSAFSNFSTTVSRGFPILNNPNIVPTVFSKTQTLTIAFGNNNISGSDSITMQISSPVSPKIYSIKTVPGSSSSIIFNPGDLATTPLGTDSVAFTMYLKNYSHITSGNKKHIFVMINIRTGFSDVNP